MGVVYIDYRENLEFLGEAFKQKGYNVKFVELPVGDIIYKDICIERKTVNDFIRSVYDNRIWVQSYSMYNNFKNRAFILIPADWILVPPEKVEMVRGAIARLSLDYGVNVLFVGNEEGLVSFACKLFEKAENPKPLATIRKYKMREEEIPLAILAQIPGVDKKKANSLLIEFGSIENIVKMARENHKALTKAPGIGNQTARAIKTALLTNVDYGECPSAPCHFYKSVFRSKRCVRWIAGKCELNLTNRLIKTNGKLTVIF